MNGAQVKGALRKFAAWLVSMLKDPNAGTASSARVCAVLCVLTACGLAIAGMALNREQSSTVVGLLGGGAANLFARTRATKDDA